MKTSINEENCDHLHGSDRSRIHVPYSSGNCRLWKSRAHHPTLAPAPPVRYSKPMYEEFTVTDRWTGESLHCAWKGTIVAIATRHADATDIRFAVNGRPVWIALPNLAWVEQKRRTGKVLTDALAAQLAGRYLKQAIESGYDNGREIYTLTVDEVLDHANAVVREAGGTTRLPSLPIIHQNLPPEKDLGIRLPGEPAA